MRCIEDNVQTIILVMAMCVSALLGGLTVKMFGPDEFTSTTRANQCEDLLKTQNESIVALRSTNGQLVANQKYAKGKLDTLIWFGRRAVVFDSLAKKQANAWDFNMLLPDISEARK